MTVVAIKQDLGFQKEEFQTLSDFFVFLKEKGLLTQEEALLEITEISEEDLPEGVQVSYKKSFDKTVEWINI